MKYVYLFNEVKNKNMFYLFGKKAIYDIEAMNLDLPIKKGLIITNEACNQFFKDNEKFNRDVLVQVNEYINQLDQTTGKKLGDINNPLIVSVKSSLKNYMPEVIDSISFVGLTYEMVEKLSENQDEYVWIWECYLNLIKNYSKVVKKIDLECYEYIKSILKNNKEQLNIEQLRELTNKLKEEYKLKIHSEFPDNSIEQLYSVLIAVFKSWDNNKANIYRKDLDISFEEGMAICIQPMVFGNLDKNSGKGTIYTRNPITGETKDEFTHKRYFVGKFSKESLESIVDENVDIIDEISDLAIQFPNIYNQLIKISKILENYYKDMLKIDFVIENNKLFIIEICIGKRSAKAALKIACDIAEEYNEKNNDSINFGLEFNHVLVKKNRE